MGKLVHEVSNQVGIHTDTVKRAESRGFITSTRDHNGWRRYGPEAIAILMKLYGSGDTEPDLDQPGSPRKAA